VATTLRKRLVARLTAVRRSVAVCAAVLLAGGIATGVSQVAGAEPKPTISQVQAEVNTLTSRYDKAVQQYDQVAQQLTLAKGRLKQVNKEMNRDQTQYDDARDKVARIASATFQDSGQTSLAGLLTASNPSAVLNAASMLLQLTGAQNQQTQAFLADAQQLSSVQTEQQHTEYGVSQLAAQRDKTKNSIKTLLDNEQAQLESLTTQQQAQVQANSLGGSTSSASGSITSVPTGTPAQTAAAVQYALNAAADKCPYVYGSTGPCSAGFDCSGLMQAAWASAGVSIPRDTYEQVAALPSIPLADIKPGDLLFYDGDGHVAMYVGDNMIVDAPHTGADVEEISINDPWYQANFDSAARP
jgi:cell wall-associated NlpC family hydrolase